ncbi:helix-turn-helix domain-containing protein [Pararcticibacter amylolyticus]|uniref:Uncharacterized protein n=1 Tax=Pararcticibacter amylolyticus TaxID=2173175 RepID=A0A2U2PKH0_9SPHI|nr:helix-turn-helix transcriptional regulator [Pararcticibacter amylolyticus]PWG81917.1 hypothetical protein DDR33_02475 [Pararcticibacter amylolyticus]
MKKTKTNEKEIIFNKLSIDHQIKTGNKLRDLRNILLLAVNVVSKATGISDSTIDRIEKGDVGVGSGRIYSLISFYGFEYQDFFKFSRPLPTEDQLRRQMKRFHEQNGCDAYKIIYSQPDLITLIEHKLLKTELFNDWVIEKTVYKFCEENFGYQYNSILNTLDLAVKKQFLIHEENSSPKRFKMNPVLLKEIDLM